MVNADLLKKHAGQYKMTRDTAGEYHKQLFTLHPELAKYYDAEDIDPDSVLKVCNADDMRYLAYSSAIQAQKFIMLGQQELQCFFRLPTVVNDERSWRSALSDFKETFGENNNMPMKEFNKVYDAFFAAMQKHAGGVTAEQKKEWMALFDKAYEDMKKWGWY
uniref:GLOBIN domain-containing protein n=1 Tax=Angiostrongylus cantonensis TaxID=6313 RepID=A0A0K0D079_ANGCA